jgi:hypothetical protein
MHEWKHKLDIRKWMKRYKGDYADGDLDAQQVAKGIAEELKQSGLFKETGFIERFDRCETEEDVNSVLDELYEYCDKERIWLGI